MSEEPAAPAPPASKRVRFHEGSIELPAGFEDRTANVFVPANTEVTPNLGIARDWLHEDESLSAYVDRQLAQFKARMAGHKLVSRGIARLGDPNRDDVLAGERIDANYKNGQRVVHQRQAAFIVAPRRVLILTASSPRPFNDAFEALWLEWIRSFVMTPAAGDAAGGDVAAPTA